LIASNRNARAPIDVLTGDPEAGRAYFNGAGTCSPCHSTTGDLAGLLMRVPDPVTLQQRWLFPTLGRSGPRQVDVVASGKRVSGTLVRIDDFSVTLRDAAGNEQSFTRGPRATVTVRDPLAVHHALLDRYTDAETHNVTTYLWTEGAGARLSQVIGISGEGAGLRPRLRMSRARSVIAWFLVACVAPPCSTSPTPTTLSQPVGDSWPVYNGDDLRAGQFRLMHR
jgi:hypothetical protein